MKQPQLVFAHTVEGLLRTLGPLSPADIAQFKELGVDPTARLEPAYPVEQYLKLMALGVKLHAPGLPFDEGVRSLGRRFVDGYGETLVGKAMLIALRMLGPRRALDRLGKSLTTGSTFFETRVTEVAPNDCQVWINRVTWPGWYQGLLERGLERSGGRDVTAEVHSHEGPGLGLTLRVRWTT